MSEQSTQHESKNNSNNEQENRSDNPDNSPIDSENESKNNSSYVTYEHTETKKIISSIRYKKFDPVYTLDNIVVVGYNKQRYSYTIVVYLIVASQKSTCESPVSILQFITSRDSNSGDIKIEYSTEVFCEGITTNDECRNIGYSDELIGMLKNIIADIVIDEYHNYPVYSSDSEDSYDSHDSNGSYDSHDSDGSGDSHDSGDSDGSFNPDDWEAASDDE